MYVSYVCTGIPDGEWASKGCRLEWEREWGGQCPVCRGELKPVAVKTVTPNLKEGTIMTTITSGPVKPVIPNNVADAIENFRKGGVPTNVEIIKLVTGGDNYVLTPRLAALRSLPFDTLLAALVNGYERELTAEQIAEATVRAAHDKIRYLYDCRDVGDAFDRGYRRGICMALTNLGIAIDGVNV